MSSSSSSAAMEIVQVSPLEKALTDLVTYTAGSHRKFDDQFGLVASNMNQLSNGMLALNSQLTAVHKWADNRFTAVEAKVDQVGDQVTFLEKKVDLAGQEVKQEIKQVASDVKSLEVKIDSFGNDAVKALLNQGSLERNVPLFCAYKHASEADHGRCLVYPFRSLWRDLLPGATPNDIYLLFNINALAVRGKELYPNDAKIMTKAKFLNAFRDIGASIFSSSG